MDIFNSQWLLNMLAKSSKTPQGRILSLFDILNDWLAAPDTQMIITQTSLASGQLIEFLTAQAKNLGAANPSILAEHITLIARNAAQQEINQPGCGSLMHAKKAANALILAQTQNEWVWLENLRDKLSAFKPSMSKPAIFGIAASIFLIVGISSMWLPALLHKQTSPLIAKSFNNETTKVSVAKSPATTRLTAQEAAAMYARYEQMRNGTCQFPEAIQIPDKDKAVYLENVVGGKIPTNLHDLAIANSYLEKVRCNFTPMLMANSR
ncbi:hypothetical protein [Methylotenera sp.]|uniref:hypothetical protein n=1 Tax=Methylotenera sp. TaxID=2051956 RepID=UPI00248974F3|nr:hypothetical protein [Methylotenera sp.]MDI1299900.1 hypothetical protein [Methylotenera sp.]